MPSSVPVIQDSAQLQPSGARLRVDADARAFGALEAQATQRVAQGLQSVAATVERVDDEYNAANAAELDTMLAERHRKRLDDPESGYLSTARGRHAMDRRQEIESVLQTDAEEIAGLARSKRAAALFRDVASRRTQAALNRIAGHVGTEFRTYQNTMSEARISESVNGMAAIIASGNFDDATINAAVGTVRAEVLEMADRLGESSDMVNQRVRDAQSSAFGLAIRQAAAINPERARAIYEHVSPGLSASERLGLETVMAQAERALEDDATDAAWVALSEGRPVPGAIWARVPGRNRIAIQNEQRTRAQQAASGGIARRDERRITDLTLMASTEREAFSEVDLRAERDRLGEEAYRRLALAQTKIRNGEESSPLSVSQLRGIREMANRQFRAAGLRDVEALGEFERDVISLTEGFRESNNRLPNAEEQMGIVRGLLATVNVRKEGAWLDDREDVPAFQIWRPYSELSQQEIDAAVADLRRRGRPITEHEIRMHAELRARRRAGAR